MNDLPSTDEEFINDLFVQVTSAYEEHEPAIEQIKGNRSHDNYCFYIDLESPLSIDAYLEFKEKLPLGFPTVKNVSFKLNLKNYTVDNIKEYINLFMDEYTKENPLLSMFKDNKCEIDNDKIILSLV